MLIYLLPACVPLEEPAPAPLSEPPSLPAPLEVECEAGAVLLPEALPFPTLQEALDAAEPGAVVAACPGNHLGPIVISAPVTLGGVGRVVLQGQGDAPALTVPGGTVLLDLVVTGGKGAAGGGISMSSGGELLVVRSVVTGNAAEEGGGLWVAPGSAVWLAESYVLGNAARSGGGIWLEDAALHAHGSLVQGNTARDGGGLYAQRAWIMGGRWAGNTARETGGGGVLWSSHALELELEDNEASWGGGLYALESELWNSRLEHNAAEVGAGLYAVSGLVLVDSQIVGHPGAGLAIGLGEVELLGGVFERNQVGAESSGEIGQVLSSWGSSWKDNVHDVIWDADTFEFGPDASFVCEGTLCESPAP
jgi:hypothetical protein